MRRTTVVCTKKIPPPCSRRQTRPRPTVPQTTPSPIWTPPSPPLDSALPPLDSGVTTVDPPVPDFSVAEREKEEEEESSLSEKLKEISRSLLSMWKDEYMDVLDRGKAKERIVQLLRREDETSREQDSEEHLQKKKKNLIDLFRDIEESGKSRQSRFWGFEIFGPIFQRPTLFCETQDVAVARFLFLRDEDGLREETRRLRRYQTLLEQWNEAFTREEHDVSLWVGECLKDVLAEVHKDISYLTRVGRLQPQCLPSKNCMSLSAYRKMKKRIMERLRLNVDELRRRETYSQYLLVLSFKNYDKLPALSTTGRFYQSSGGKTSRSLSVRNTRKYLRRLHTRGQRGAH
ncbi:hypothetical protein NL108_018381 [Boleophthalmus pectinirostris]|uniref:uncharacterized protein LOC110174229 n=1 Tax=Boleophthalmus pectinirostris TaxID=150288 RepID=UPI00242EE985|nr:uncharacterized protein LOC110174229 [Boleophthalmus pectinirostris]KAJ0068263.1 hypothetical protein NL108_018381 [Boleophthalmus pectinirostris]